jgi:hypothetical protein
MARRVGSARAANVRSRRLEACIAASHLSSITY